MFDGNSRSRREINLSGRSRKTSRSSVVQNTKNLRNERRKQQLYLTSITKLQKLVRGYKCRKNVISNLGNESSWLVVSMKLSPNIKPWVNIRQVFSNIPWSQDWNVVSDIAFSRICHACVEILHLDKQEKEYDEAIHKKCVHILSQILQQQQRQKENGRILVQLSSDSFFYPCVRDYFWSRSKQDPDEIELAQILLRFATLQADWNMLSCIFFAFGDIQQHPLYSQLNKEHNLLRLLDTLSVYLVSIEGTNVVKSFILGREVMIVHNAWKLLITNDSTPATLPNLRIMLRYLDYTLAKDRDASNFGIWCSAAAADISFSAFGVENGVIMEEESSDEDDDEEDGEDPRNTSKKEYLLVWNMSKLQAKEIMQRVSQTPCPPEKFHELIQFLSCSRFLYDMATILFSSTPTVEEVEAYCRILFQMLHAGSPMHFNSSARVFSQPLLLQLSFPSSSSTSSPTSHSKNVLLDTLHKIICAPSFGPSAAASKAQVLFCEIFLCTLLPMRDEELFSLYGSYLPSVVEWLAKHCLYDLYYSHPILQSEQDEVRQRLFLAGTKLYNALHERYSRCGGGGIEMSKKLFGVAEEDWYFPAMRFWEPSSSSSSMDISSSDSMENIEDGENLSKLLQTNPKISRILTSLPQSVPFDRRVALFTALLEADKRSNQVQDATSLFDLLDNPESNRYKLSFRIRRNYLYEDAFKEVISLTNPKDFKKRTQITFVNQHGAEEAGIDGGGVFKEFLDDLIIQSFNPKQGYFSVSSPYLQTLVIDPSNAESENSDMTALTEHYLFLGRVLGKAVYEGILVEPQLSLPLLNKLAGRNNTLDDLKNLDDQLYHNLIKLRTMSPEELSTLELTFEYQSVELIPHGSETPVTSSNVIRFLHTLANYKLNLHHMEITRAFVRGFKDIVSPVWIRLFSTLEVQKLISGDDTPLNVHSLKSIMQYSGGYHISQVYVQQFWEVLEEMSPSHQRLFLKFMTSCSRQPLLGFSSLVPIPCIHQVRLIPDPQNDSQYRGEDQRLPTASTCMNLLKLPNYGNKNILRKKLLYSIQAGAGFELS